MTANQHSTTGVVQFPRGAPPSRAAAPAKAYPMTVHINRPGRHCRYRLFEWISTIMMLGIGMSLLLSPATVRTEPFLYLMQFGFSSFGLGILFGALGSLRIVALYLNGRLPTYGPRARALGALVGSAIWGEMLASLLSITIATGMMSIGHALFAPLMFGDLVSCYRAAADVRDG